MNLTDTELNLAMAEWVGWTSVQVIGEDLMGIPPNTRGIFICCPSYLSDDSPRRLLNEAESRLTGKQRSEFLDNLDLVVCADGDYWALVSATASHRVSAILKTVKPELFQ